MGFWQCNDGTMVEMIFDDEGKFLRFGDGTSEESAEKAKKEIFQSIYKKSE